jgi:hypothetical protein
LSWNATTASIKKSDLQFGISTNFNKSFNLSELNGASLLIKSTFIANKEIGEGEAVNRTLKDPIEVKDFDTWLKNQCDPFLYSYGIYNPLYYYNMKQTILHINTMKFDNCACY